MRKQVLYAACVLLLGIQAGCPGANEKETEEPGPDLASSAPDLGCFRMPTTHVEILNACTDAQSVDKRVVLPLLLPDGKLPPLP